MWRLICALAAIGSPPVAMADTLYVVRADAGGICSVQDATSASLGRILVEKTDLKDACTKAKGKFTLEMTGDCTKFNPGSHTLCKTVKVELPGGT